MTTILSIVTFAIILITGIVMVVISTRRTKFADKIAEEWTHAQGEVVFVRSTRVGNNSPTYYWTIKYTFNGEEYVTEKKSPPAGGGREGKSKGDIVGIYVNPTMPDEMGFEWSFWDRFWMSLMKWGGILMLICWVAGGIAIIFFLKKEQ